MTYVSTLDKIYIDSVHFMPPQEICKTFLFYAEDWVDETSEYLYRTHR